MGGFLHSFIYVRNNSVSSNPAQISKFNGKLLDFCRLLVYNYLAFLCGFINKKANLIWEIADKLTGI